VRVQSIQLTMYKGISVTVPWSPSVVLFGPNDSGKTNILEALLTVFALDASDRTGITPTTRRRTLG
jgi:recombinational DNA repair ATPase RecF